ncbi:MAG: glycerol-3-phosphate dehydrogenase/oxidase [Anaerolineae bacterium]|nr:glycerol-3-phosphate dehydrogenase/oxidase [Anaerolineae bacterium]
MERNAIWNDLAQPWDLIIAGGGITGAGILREATRLGLRAVLFEQRDFAWGTSSRSSKLVHGGLRYLAQGRIGLLRTSVQERENLLDAGPGLVQPLGFLWATYEGSRPGRWLFEAGLSLYDLLAWQWSHTYHDAPDFHMLAPHLRQRKLQGGFAYGDAQTDDARLVLRLLQEAVADGATALNYARVAGLLREDGAVRGVIVEDTLRGPTQEIRGRAVVNATGAWADRLRQEVGAHPRLRPLRGSHLVFPAWRLPVAQAVSFAHPHDGRPVFIFPWEGVTIVGTTDVDHHTPLDEEPRISTEETAYLMAAVATYFPGLDVRLEEAVSSFAGVRPVIGTGAAPSEESRDHVVWQEDGLLTVTGGKLTTFRRIARDALEALRPQLPQMGPWQEDAPALSPAGGSLDGNGLDATTQQRLWGRYGALAPQLVAAAQPGELAPIGTTPTLWAELRWAARAEQVVHLEDLLLRRLRLGLIAPQGGAAHKARIQAICQEELGWDEARWQAEWAAYHDLWRCCYAPPDPALVPDWEPLTHRPPQGQTLPPWLTFRRLAPLGALLSFFLLLLARLSRRR